MLSTPPIIAPTAEDSTEQDLISNIPGAYTEFTQQQKPKSLADAANFQYLPKLHGETAPSQPHTGSQTSTKGNDKDKDKDYDYDLDNDEDFDRSSSYSRLTDEYYGDHDFSDYYGDLALYASLHHHDDLQNIERFHNKPSAFASRDGNLSKHPTHAYAHTNPEDNSHNYEMGDSQTLPMTESFADLLDPHVHSSDHSHEDAFGNSHTDRGFTYPPTMPVVKFPAINSSSSGLNSSSSNIQINFVNGEPVFPRTSSSTYKPEADAVSNLSSKSFVNKEYVMHEDKVKDKLAQPEPITVSEPQEDLKSVSDRPLNFFPEPSPGHAQTFSPSSSPATSDTVENESKQTESSIQLPPSAQKNESSSSYPKRRGFRLCHETDILYEDPSVHPVRVSVDNGPKRRSSIKHAQQNKFHTSSDAGPTETRHRSFILNNEDVNPAPPSTDTTSQASQDPTVNTESSSPSYYHNGRRVHNNTLTPYPSVSDATSMDVSSITSYDLR
ncbi:uncharacterized protein SOCG_01584 [Schizosaccharomyces octosporus yFS286]|uniref:Uncharacterized protein n=1 Tax=Schizosaccharomyces octosporus (strain yFS286) TaxID=483514 RepID=S9PQ53_SCHOY|nr:uncharacterized protein SOCG_01584 [Schizosaccharomyces octosporus yFS286]EPX71366.1 hypothetical protein SOCG_01584 [Schizosaccharomyces octosporus yFS286]